MTQHQTAGGGTEVVATLSCTLAETDYCLACCVEYQSVVQLNQLFHPAHALFAECAFTEH